MNVERVLAFIDAIDRANLNATRVVLLDAGLSNDVCHSFTRWSRFIPVTKGGKVLMEVRASGNLSSPVWATPFPVADTNSVVLQSSKSEKQV